MYDVKIQPVESHGDYRNKLIITDDSGTREYWDGGEPEDNSFGRDYSWIGDEFQRAYEQGKKDARL